MAIHTCPLNIREFVAEITPAYEGLYGTEAASGYERIAPGQLAQTISHPQVHAYAMSDDNIATALLFVGRMHTRLQVSFFHVLGGATLDTGARLLNFALEDLATRETLPIFTDYIPFCELNLDTEYEKWGFSRIERQLMHRNRAEGTIISAFPRRYDIRAASLADMPQLANVLHRAYEFHPEQFLFEEVQDQLGAEQFLDRYHGGAYGHFDDEFILGAWENGDCIGFALGSEVVTGFGFVLHMAVLPGHQRRGLGLALLESLATRFRDCGLSRIGLGVTCDNPAARLYQRSGFETLCPFPVYYRL